MTHKMIKVFLVVAVLLSTGEALAQFHPHPRPGWHAPRAWRYRAGPGYRVWYVGHRHVRGGARPLGHSYVSVHTGGPFWMGVPILVYRQTVYEGDFDTAPATSGGRMDWESEETAESDGDEWGTYDCEDGQCPSQWERKAMQGDGAGARENADRAFEDLENEVRRDNAAARTGPEAAQPGGKLDRFPEAPNDGNMGTIEPMPDMAPDTQVPAIGDGDFDAEMEEAILELINVERAAEGLPPVQAEGKLRQAARQHSQEMAALGYFAHESPVEEFKTLPMRLEHSGVSNYGWAGENIAMSTAATAQQFVKMWMDSPGHRANILRPEFKYTGIGVFGSGSGAYATQVFSSAR